MNLLMPTTAADELEGFNLRRAAKKAVGYTPAGFLANQASKANWRKIAEYTPHGQLIKQGARLGRRIFRADGYDATDSLAYDGLYFTATSSEELEYAKGRGKARAQQFGKWAGKVGRQGLALGASIGASALPGVGGNLLQGLANRLAPGTAPTPEGVIQAAQTPAAAQQVVATLAPRISDVQSIAAQEAIIQANTQAQAAQVANALAQENAKKEQEAKAKRQQTLLIAGIGGAVVVVIVLVLALRRK